VTLRTSVIREASDADLPSIIGLRQEAGWHAFTWALRDAMQPPHAHFLVADDGGEVIACGSAISYGPFGVLGNMVVSATHRRRGVGSELLRRLLAFLDERGCRSVELFATDAGKPLYERFGFRVVSSGLLITVPSHAADASRGDLAIEVRAADPADAESLAAYDAPRFGGDRGAILRHALADAERRVLVALRAGQPVGYAVIRQEGDRLGPWVAEGPPEAAPLLEAAFAQTHSTSLATNIARDNQPGVAWLRDIAIEVRSHDGRMRLGKPVRRRPETLYGTTVGALG
jgi:predicted N-acetyltransferase YhbS